MVYKQLMGELPAQALSDDEWLDATAGIGNILLVLEPLHPLFDKQQAGPIST